MRAKARDFEFRFVVSTIMYKLQCGQKVKNCNCGELTQNAGIYTDALHNVKKIQSTWTARWQIRKADRKNRHAHVEHMIGSSKKRM